MKFCEKINLDFLPFFLFTFELKVESLVCVFKTAFKKYVAMIGFSIGIGTPCFVDSEGIVRMLNRGLGNTWTPVCNTREHCKGKSDHYWVVGIHENPQQLR